MTNELATLDTNQWEVMKQQAKMLVQTGFLPSEIKNAEQAVAIMLTGRELGLPTMYALSNISVIKGKPAANAAVMLSLIYRDHGDDAAKWDDEATNDKVATLLYKRRGWSEYKQHTFTIEDAQRAGLAGGNTWKQYPGAMLRARCISAVARMAFPDSIGGMYTPEELGAPIMEQVDDDHERAMKRLHAIARENGIDHEGLHNMAVQEYNVGSLKELSNLQLTDLAANLDYITVDSEVIDGETGEIALDDNDLGQDIIDEYLAAIYAAQSKAELVAIGEQLRDSGLSSDDLRDAYSSRLKELTPPKRAKQAELVTAGTGSAGDDHRTR